MFSSFAGSPSLSSSVTVVIVVDDVNDMVPSFSSMSYHTSISEGVATGSDVLLVNASDGDAGPNGAIRYLTRAGLEWGPSGARAGP